MKKYIILFVIALFIISILSIFYFKNKITDNTLCHADLVYSLVDREQSLEMNTLLSLFFKPNNKIGIKISGDVYFERKRYKISRLLNYSYEVSGNRYNLSNGDKVIYNGDDFPVDIDIPGFPINKKDLFYKIDKIDEIGYLFSTVYSPIFICSNNL